MSLPSHWWIRALSSLAATSIAGCAATLARCHKIQRARSPVSPSGMRLRCAPSRRPISAKAVSASG